MKIPSGKVLRIADLVDDDPARRDRVVSALKDPAQKFNRDHVDFIIALGIAATRVLGYIVYQASPRDPIVLAGAVLAMLLLGLVSTWAPAQRALSVNPSILMREE